MDISDDDINKIIGNGDQCDESAKTIDSHVTELMKSFDTVQILCTRHVDGEMVTQYWGHGMGNSFARFGHMEMYLQAEKDRYVQLMNGKD